MSIIERTINLAIVAVVALSLSGCACTIHRWAALAGMDYDTTTLDAGAALLIRAAQECMATYNEAAQNMTANASSVSMEQYCLDLAIGSGGLNPILEVVDVEIGATIGRGSHDYSSGLDDYPFGATAKTARELAGNKTTYNAFHLYAHARYPLKKTEEKPWQPVLLAGPSLYHWAAVDCPWGAGCTETTLRLNVGAGMEKDNLGFDVYTRVPGGPHLLARFRYFFGKAD